MALQGRALVEIQDSLSLDDLWLATPAWAGTTLDADWRETVQALIARAGARGAGVAR